MPSFATFGYKDDGEALFMIVYAAGSITILENP
jgi:hypothetical protein